MVCPRPLCDVQFPWFTYMEHFNTHDHVKIMKFNPKGKKGIFNIESSDKFFTKWKTLEVKPMELEFEDKIFLFLTFRDDVKEEWHFYVTLIGAQVTAAKYKFIICVSSQNNVSIKVRYLNTYVGTN